MANIYGELLEVHVSYSWTETETRQLTVGITNNGDQPRRAQIDFYAEKQTFKLYQYLADESGNPTGEPIDWEYEYEHVLQPDGPRWIE
ncbi:MAG: hypothetical protein JXR37_01890 [Kiritimatiellae bacterium]|nr:hypothetical protein [Kiritimatiellia bacterium]